MAAFLSEYVVGTLFGSALFAAGVFSPSTIIAQMRLEDFTMVKAMLGASAISAIAIHLANYFNHAPLKPRTPQSIGFFPYSGNVIGGAMIGFGMATTGACPGTVFVQTGTGISSGHFVLLGCMLGGLLFVTSQPYISKPALKTPSSTTTNKPTALTIPQSLGVSPWIVLTGWVVMCAGLLNLIHSIETPTLSLTSLVSPLTGGILIGLAQTSSLLLTRHTIGTSGAFEDIGRLLRHFPTSKSFLTTSMIFDIGIISASFVLSYFYRGSVAMADMAVVEPLMAVLGGVVMAFGSRLAGGCTSGHGISGMATFSWASVVSVASMFASGVATAAILG